MNLDQMERMADDALERAELERLEQERQREVDQYLTRVEAAKKIKARRRRLGKSGTTPSGRRMSVPSRKVAHPTRNSA